MYCPNGSLVDLWVSDKMSECFLDTTAAGVLTVFMVLFGTAQCSVYRKYSTPLSQAAIPQSKLYYAQMIITFLIPLLAVTKFFVDVYIFQMGVVYGYQVHIYFSITRFITYAWMPINSFQKRINNFYFVSIDKFGLNDYKIIHFFAPII